MPEITLDSFKETLDVLIDANPHARNKGDEFKTWSKDNFDCDARISYIKEQRQITNRVSEQFRYFAPIVVFVCVSEVKRDTLMKYILERVYKQLENVAIIGVTQSDGQKRYTFEQLIVFKQTAYTEWATPVFGSVKDANILADELGVTINPLDEFGIDFAWYVGTTGNDAQGQWHDFSDEYIEQGVWENGWDDKFLDIVNSIKIGDRIAIKSTFTQKHNLPFNNNGKKVCAMRIKAIGVVTGNSGDGKHIQVDWTRLDPAKTWYGPGTLRETIHSVSANDGYVKKQLLDFTFADKEQDYSICEERYKDDTDTDTGVDEPATDENGEGATTETSPVVDESLRLTTGCNVLLYGVPGSGKSWTIEHEYCKPTTKVERLVFHPDYTYSDFIGQILPAVDAGGQVSYKFTPGPFTNILRDAYLNPKTEYILIIEEINRGNAPAIFGEVFQLLDRKVDVREFGDDGLPVGTSEYGITNANIATIVYGDPTHKVRIPSNLSVIGTMNTSDQNVFTLDTAFQRRWDMRLIENNFDNVDPSLAEAEILDTTISWRSFCTEINKIVVGNGARMSSAEDKRLGAYFVHLRDLKFNSDMGNLGDGEYDALRSKERSGALSDEERTRLSAIRDAMKQNRRFPEKVIKYLWDDAFKFNREVIFETTEYQSLEQVIRAFMYAEKLNRFRMFKENVRSAFSESEG